MPCLLPLAQLVSGDFSPFRRPRVVCLSQKGEKAKTKPQSPLFSAQLRDTSSQTFWERWMELLPFSAFSRVLVHRRLNFNFGNGFCLPEARGWNSTKREKDKRINFHFLRMSQVWEIVTSGDGLGGTSKNLIRSDDFLCCLKHRADFLNF